MTPHLHTLACFLLKTRIHTHTHTRARARTHTHTPWAALPQVLLPVQKQHPNVGQGPIVEHELQVPVLRQPATNPQ